MQGARSMPNPDSQKIEDGSMVGGWVVLPQNLRGLAVAGCGTISGFRDFGESQFFEPNFG
jgi:hypothetical protein